MISIVIPSKDRLDLLKQCIGSIKKYFTSPYQIIVVENGGHDGSVKWCWRNGYDVIERASLTFAQACNLGVAKSRSQWLLLCNNDIIFTQPLDLSKLDATKAILGMRLVYPNGLIQHGGVGFDLHGNPYHLWHLAVREQPEAGMSRQVPAVTFACAFIHRDIWNNLGGLDESYTNAYEDLDFCYRAREAGWNIWYQGQNVATHLTEQTEGRNDHITESWQVFANKWIATGRLWNVLGIWPFETRR